jgi:hypothetical protein
MEIAMTLPDVIVEARNDRRQQKRKVTFLAEHLA